MKSRFRVEQIINILRECEVSENKIEVWQKIGAGFIIMKDLIVL